MVQPPSLKSFPHYPVTAGISVAAITVTALWWFGSEPKWAFVNAQVWD